MLDLSETEDYYSDQENDDLNVHLISNQQVKFHDDS